MTDIKKCAACGNEFFKQKHLSPAEWARRVCCSRSCAARLATVRNTGKAKNVLPQTKVCAYCGKEFARKTTDKNYMWSLRRYCSQSCAGRAGHRADNDTVIVPLHERCDCGNEATTHVWVVQGSADGRLTTQRIYVCADCVEMWVEDGATVKRPPSPRGYRLWSETNDAGNEYHATAHLVSWHMRKGARP